MSVAVVMRCDINTCKAESKEMRKARMLDKEYDLCPNCYAKLADFIGRRLEGGRTIPESPSSRTIQIGGGIVTGPQPWPLSGGYTLGGQYTTNGYIPLSISSSAQTVPVINPDVQAVFDIILGSDSFPTNTIIDAPEK